MRHGIQWARVGSVLLLFAFAGCHPLKAYYKEIEKAGYIPYQNVMAHSGTGALVGGVPAQLQLIAPPETCFPSKVNGVETELRFRDESTLPSQSRIVTTNFKANVQVLRGISTANGTISAGLEFNHVSQMELNFEGVHIEYMDSVRLAEFYRSKVPELCKDFLENYAVILQALQADKLRFVFKTKDGAALKLTQANLNEIVSIGGELKYEITHDVELVITTPKYIGYQLGRLQRIDNGIALWRATRVSQGKFVFEWISLFKPEENPGLFGAEVSPFEVSPEDFLPVAPGSEIQWPGSEIRVQ